MHIHHAGAVIYAKKPERVAAFYEHVAGVREGQFQGVTVCDGYDPEGNVLRLRQQQNAER